jgi:hypothetical protein
VPPPLPLPLPAWLPPLPGRILSGERQLTAWAIALLRLGIRAIKADTLPLPARFPPLPGHILALGLRPTAWAIALLHLVGRADIAVSSALRPTTPKALHIIFLCQDQQCKDIIARKQWRQCCALQAKFSRRAYGPQTHLLESIGIRK